MEVPKVIEKECPKCGVMFYSLYPKQLIYYLLVHKIKCDRENKKNE